MDTLGYPSSKVKGRVIQVDLLKKIVKCAVISPYIKGEKPISLMIVAKPESGKTTTMKVYRNNKGIQYLTDATAYGITRDLLPKLVSGEIKTLMIADFTTPLSRVTKTRKNFIAFLNNLIEEGVAKMTTYATIWEKDVKANVIAGITDKALYDGRTHWANIGFLSRFVIFSYSYGLSHVSKILEYYSRDDLELEEYETEKIKIPEDEVNIVLPKEIADKLDGVSQKIGTLQELYGIRAKINMRSLIKCIAYLNGREKVTLEDYEELLELAEYMNLNFNIIR